jgi:hypothetical protein
MVHLNELFKHNNIKVTLAAAGPKGPTINVKTDGSIPADAVHGRTSASASGGRLTTADVVLPIKVTINTPQGVRDAGPGVLEVIAAHEFIHALGQGEHTTLLMTRTMYKQPGDNAAGDRLKAEGGTMPPLKLAPDTVSMLKDIWN